MNFVFLFSLSELDRHLFARSTKILLILSSISHFHTCTSLSLYHLSLSDPLNHDREVEKKIKEQAEAKKSVTCQTKREKKEMRRGENSLEGEMMKKECNNESSSI